MLRKSVTFTLIVLSLCAVVFAADAKSTIELALPSWLPLFGAALAIGFGLAAIAYAISTSFNLPELSVWAKTEVAELTSSAMLAAIILIVAGFSDSLFTAATGSTPMQISGQFVDTLATKSLSLFSESVMLNWLVGALSGIPPQYTAPVATPESKEDPKSAAERYAQAFDKMRSAIKSAGIQIPLMFIDLSVINVQFYDYSGANTFLGHFGFLQSVTLGAAGLAIGIKLILSFVEAVALPVLVPLGVFMSIFTITRKMGRTLIAIGICLYFFFPASVLISKMMYDGVYKPGTIPPEIQSPTSVNEFKSFALIQLSAQIVLMGAGVALLYPLITGVPPYQATCPAEAAIIAAPCTLAYVACYIAYLMTCTFFIKPFITWPMITFINYIIYTTATVFTKFATIASQVPAGPAAIIAATAPVPGLSGIGSFTASFYINKYVAEMLANVTLDYTPYIIQYAVPITLIPVIMFVIVITAMRSISPAIGGEVQILGVSELI